MPRQIEVQSADGSTWEVWDSPADPKQYPWRYVGGVLEGAAGDEWRPMAESVQQSTLEELRAKFPDWAHLYRLRPYDDAPVRRSYEVRCSCGRKSTAGLGESRVICVCGRGHEPAWPVFPVPSPALQAEQQKQHAGRRVYGLAAGGNYVRFTGPPEPPIPATQRPADASVAPESPESRAALVSTLRAAQQRANALADTCGALRTELDEAYARIGRLTREVERLGRKKQ